MSKPHPFRGALCAVLAIGSIVACAGDSNQADPYYGVDSATDGTNVWFDSKFVGQVCGNTGQLPCRDSSVRYACPTTAACYPQQLGYVAGNPLNFFNLTSMSTIPLPIRTCAPAPAACTSGTTLYVPNPIPTSVADPQLLGGGGAHVDVFPHSCAPASSYDPRVNSYPTSSQFPIFNALPVATTAFGAVVYPIVATYGVTLTSTETCNDLKDSSSIADASNPGGGSYGATRTAQPTGYQLWAPIDPNVSFGKAPILAGALNPNYAPLTGWFNGLQVPYLDGGPIPTGTVTTNGVTSTVLLAMDGVIVDPAGSAFSDVTDNKVILLPAAPGDDAYSPIVRLHDYHLQTGQSIGTVTSICQPSDPHPCPATSADYTKASSSPFYIIFIVSTPQQTQ